jgi:hypothetical protein
MIAERFTHNLFHDLLEAFAKHLGPDLTRLSEGVKEIRNVFEGDPELSSIFRIVTKNVRETVQSSLVFLEHILEDTE